LRSAIRTGGYETKSWEKLQFDTHDKIWSLLADRLDDLDGLDVAVEALEKMWKSGDLRFRNANRALSICRAICTYLRGSSTKKSDSAIRAAALRFDRALKLLNMRRDKFPEDSRNPSLIGAIGSVSDRFGVASNSSAI
jgi:hypothetical protein